MEVSSGDAVIVTRGRVKMDEQGTCMWMDHMACICDGAVCQVGASEEWSEVVGACSCPCNMVSMVGGGCEAWVDEEVHGALEGWIPGEECGDMAGGQIL